VGVKGLVTHLPNAKCWGWHATEAGHCSDFVEATRVLSIFCHVWYFEWILSRLY